MANEIPISVVDRKIKVGRHVPATMTNIGKDYLSISLDNEWSSTNHRLRVTLYSDAPYVSVQNWWDGKSAIEIPQEITSCPAFKVTVALISEDGYERLVTQAMDEPIENPRNEHDEGVEPGARTMDIIARIDALAADLEQKRDTDYWRGEPGAPGAPGAPGEPGADGYSPTANVTKDGGTATITVTDKNGTTTATVSDGAPGSDANVTKENVEAALGYEPLNAAYANKIYIMQKQIENLQGIAATEETDSTEAYTKTVPTGAQKWASLDKVCGKTVVLNQLAKYVKNYTQRGITAVGSDDGSVHVTGTCETGNYAYIRLFELNITIIGGHKYFVAGGADRNFDSPDYCVYFDRKTSSVIIPSKGVIITGEPSTTFLTFLRVQPGTTIDATFTPQLFDLTKMFGAGNEPATIEEFRAMFPADYYPYNPGELMSAEVVEVESKGKNLLDPSYSTGAFTGGMPLSLLKVGESYTISSTKTRLFKISDVYDGNGTQKLGESFTFTVTSDNVDKRIFCLSNNSPYLPISIDDVRNTCQLERGTIATAYSPYGVKGTFHIPAEVREMCPGYGWSAGTVCNEIDFGRKVYVQRVGSVDLGTLDWDKNNEYDEFRSYGFKQAKAPSKPSIAANLLCETFITITVNQSYRGNKVGIALSPESYFSVGVLADAYPDATSFKAAMSGVLLYYELAEPIEVDLSNVLPDDHFIEVEAGGTVTFKQASTQLPVPSAVTYQVSTKEVVANA